MVNAAPELPAAVAALYPFQARSFTTPAGARMSYLDEGPRSDEAVLLLHGNPTWSFYYRNVVRLLSPTIRCIAPDHIGMGLSEKPERYPYVLEQRIRDIEALVASLGLKRIHLVVHDWGGAIGMGFAGRAPGRIGRMVILNTAAFPSDRIPKRIALCGTPLLGAALVRGLNGFAGPATRMSMHRRRLTDEEREGYLFPYDSWSNRVAVHAFVRDIPMHERHPSWSTLVGLRDRLELLREKPALLLWGGKDFCFNDNFLAEWQRILPGAETKRIPDAGHYVLEDAAEAPGIVAEFLTTARRG